jgi:hypothetical protein
LRRRKSAVLKSNRATATAGVSGGADAARAADAVAGVRATTKKAMRKEDVKRWQ